MKKEIRKIITIIKAAPNLKANTISSIITLCVGMILLAKQGFLTGTGKILFITCTTFIQQAIMLSSGSGLIQSSSSAKRMQTFYPCIIQFPFSILMYTIIAFHSIYIDTTFDISWSCWFIILYSILIAGLEIMPHVNYKYFGFGFICTMLIIIPYAVIICNFEKHNILHLPSSLALTNAVIIGYLIVITGSLLSILIANLLYKSPISAHVMKANTKA